MAVVFPPSELPDFIGTTQPSDFLFGIWVPCFVSLVIPHTLQFGKTKQDIPSCCNISMYDVPRSTTPKESLLSCHCDSRDIAFCAPEHISLLILGISELNPFNQLAFGPSPNCLRLKIQVTLYPPRLATSEWLILSRWEFHPLYVAT